MKNLILFVCLVTIMLLPLAAFAQKAAPGDAILGKWFNAEKDAKIEIYKSDGKYFGKIVWLKFPNDEKGKPKTDIENPDPKLQNRPKMGLVILTGLNYKSDNSYEKGRIYDPKSGKTYSCQTEIIDKGKMKLRGYIGVSLIGRTSEWVRTQ
jgi:uncharacterized protein (DUF2147 family)